MTTAPPTDVEITDMADETRSLSEWLTTFPIAMVVLDPFTYESSWILDTALRLFGEYSQADVRLAFLVTADVEGTRAFLGPLTDEVLAFADPERSLTRALELESLPALVVVRQDGQLIGSAEGWDPDSWRGVTEALSDQLSWHRPMVPAAGDPVAYPGTPALP
ncbi:MAG: hypothetical protein OES57_11075 [Acidimicrobiia bacterium]|nr:hypothetical protein [Acidimicrobiia bacterium]